MGSLVNAIELEVLDHIFKVGSYTPDSTLYLALFTADPTETGSVTNEATYTGYDRAAITFAAASSRSITQSGQIDFPACSGGSSTVSHWGICASDVPTTDDMIAYGAFTTPKAVTTGYQPFVATGEVYVEFSAGGIATAQATVLLEWLFRGGTFSQATDLKVALFSTACSDSAAGTELSGNGYARTTCNTWDTAASGATANTGAITFPQATGGAWATVTHAAIYLDTTYTFWMTVNNLTVLENEYARFIAGALDVTLT